MENLRNVVSDQNPEGRLLFSLILSYRFPWIFFFILNEVWVKFLFNFTASLSLSKLKEF